MVFHNGVVKDLLGLQWDMKVELQDGMFLLKIGDCETMVSNFLASLARAEPFSCFLAAFLGLYKRHPSQLLFNYPFSIRPL